MIDRERTIRNAVARYNIIYPVRGKHLLEESFFCLRGEYHLVFMTQDKKVHTMKACRVNVRPVHTPVIPKPSNDVFNSIFKMLNKPIIVREILVRKPVKTCIINLFPIPSVTWSAMESVEDTAVLTRPLGNVSQRQPHRDSRIELTAPTGITNTYPTGEQSVPVSHPTYPELRQALSRQKSFYHLEVVAPGCFPVTIDREMFMPQKNVAPVRKVIAPYPVAQNIVQEPPAAPRPYAWPTYDER